MIFVWLVCACSISAQDGEAYKFKLDYDVPESPALSIVDANPTTVMRGSAAKELAINIANNFITQQSQQTGVALDFNPYFAFGGRLKNVSVYREKYFARLLANTQLSFASTAVDQFPNDNLMSLGLRITLFDSADLLYDDQLGVDIGNALAAAVSSPDAPVDDSMLPGNVDDQPRIVTVQSLADAYLQAQARVKNKKGGALSIGAATAQRALGGILSADSLVNYRSQVWMAGQYNFGNGTNLLCMGMYRNTQMEGDTSTSELILGAGIRSMGKVVNVGGELVYNSEKNYLEINGNVETKLFSNVLLIVSFGNGSGMLMNENNSLFVKPTLKYNLSQPKN